MKDQEPPRLTIAEAFRRIKEAISSDTSKRFADSIDVYVRDGPGVDMSPAGWNIPEDSEMHLEMIVGKEVAIKHLKAEFQAFCNAESVNPRSLNRPRTAPPYSGRAIDDYEYDISVEEYERWAAPYLHQTTHLKLDELRPKEETATERTSGGKGVPDADWPVKAKAIADEFHLRDLTNSAWDSMTHMAKRVSDEMLKRGIIGTQGPVTPATVKRDVLQGGKWVRPKPKSD